MDARTRGEFRPAARRARLAFLHADPRHRCARGALRALLHAARGSGSAILLLPARLHGLDDRPRPVGEPDPARLLLGTDQPLLLPADRLLVSYGHGARRCT